MLTHPVTRLKCGGHPHYALAEQFADDRVQNAFDPGYDHSPLEHFEPLVRGVFGRSPRGGPAAPKA